MAVFVKLLLVALAVSSSIPALGGIRGVVAQMNGTTAAPHTAASIATYTGTATAPRGIAVPVMVGRPATYSATAADVVAVKALAPQLAYVADTSAHRITALTMATAAASQQVTHIAGSQTGVAGTADGAAATAARFNSPFGVLPVLPAGADGSARPTVYVADTLNHCLRAIDQSTPTAAVVSTVAGVCNVTGNIPDAASSATPVAGTAARFNRPTHLTLVTTTASAAIIVTDTGNRCIRQMDLATKQIRTIAGQCGSAPVATVTDGSALGAARLDAPWGVMAVRGGSTVYFTENTKGLLRKLEGGQVTTVIGSGTGINPTFGIAYLRPLASEGAANPSNYGTLIIGGTTAVTGDAPTGGLLSYDERDGSRTVFAALPAAAQATGDENTGESAFVVADTTDAVTQPDPLFVVCCPRAPPVSAAPQTATTTAAAVTTTAAPVTTTPPPRTKTATKVLPPRTQTRTLIPFVDPVAVPSTFFISATVLADLTSLSSERQIVLHLYNARWNETWCSTEPRAEFRPNSSAGFADLQPCGVLANANKGIIGLNSIQCTPTHLYLTFLPLGYFALLRGESENILYNLVPGANGGSYIILPDGAAAAGIRAVIPPLPVRFVADQTGNVTCDPNATVAPPPTNATTLPPIYRIPWPTEVDILMWNIVAGVAAAASVVAGSTAGLGHVAWMHRMALLCSHNCNWENVTDVPLQNNPFQVSFDDVPAPYDDYESSKFQPFISGMILNLAFCAGVSLLHVGVSFVLGLKANGVKPGMARAHFPAAVTFPLWAWFYVPTLSAAITIFAKSAEAPSLDPMVPGVAGVILLVFIAVLAAHAVVVVGQLNARAVKIDPKTQATHWLTTPIQLWGDRLGFEGYTQRFGTIFWMFSGTRHWYFFAELGLLTAQAGLAAVRTLHPDCQTATFTPLAITGVLGLFASLVLDPFLVFTDRIASYVFNLILVAGGIVAAFLGSEDESLGDWATRIDQIGLGAMAVSAVYSLGMAAVVAGRWGRGITQRADTATEAEERKLAAEKTRRVGAEGEPKELIRDLSPEEEEELRRQAEEDARLAAAPALDPSILAEPDQELREVLMRGSWVRMETPEGPYYYNRHTGKSVWDLRDEIGLAPLYRKKFKVNDLSEDDEDEDDRNPLQRKLLERSRASPIKKRNDPVADALAKREWVAIVDPGSGRTYYANPTTQETTWDLEEKLGVKDQAQKQRELEEEAKKLVDPLDEVLAKGEWERVEPPDGGKPYFYHKASRKTVWNLRKELGLEDPKKALTAPPPPPPAIPDRTVVPAKDIEMLANLMSPESPDERLPAAIEAEAKIWWIPGTTKDVADMTADSHSPSRIGNPLAAGDMTTFASPALMRMLQEQQELPTRRDDPVSMMMAHALATGEWIELPPAHEGEAPSFINPVTKQVCRDLRSVFEAEAPSNRDPVKAALANKEWIEIMDPVSRRPFYVHVVSKRTVWDLRAELEGEAKQKRRGDRKASVALPAAAGGGGQAAASGTRTRVKRRGGSSASGTSSASASSSDGEDRNYRRGILKPPRRREGSASHEPRASPRRLRDPLDLRLTDRSASSSDDNKGAKNGGRSRKGGTSSSNSRSRSRSRRYRDHDEDHRSRRHRDYNDDSRSDDEEERSRRRHRSSRHRSSAHSKVAPGGAAASPARGRDPAYGTREYYQDLWDCL